MTIKHNRTLLFVLFFGILIRMCLLFYDYSFDVNNHMTWGREAIIYGMKGMYDNISAPNYPPLAIYMFQLSYLFNNLLFSIAWYLNTHLALFPSAVMHYFDINVIYAGITKLGAVCADIGIAIVMFKISASMDKKSYKAPLIAAGLVMLNPIFFYNSALWGQIDSIPLFFLVACFYVMIVRKHYTSATICFALALLSKQSAIIFIPLYIFILIKKSGWKHMFIHTGIIACIFFIAFLPFYRHGNILFFPFITYVTKMVTVSGLPFVSNHAFNAWAVITGWRDIPDTAVWFGMPYRYWGYLITAPLIFFIFMHLRNKTLTMERVCMAAFLMGALVFLFFTKIHERHLLQALTFLIPLAALHKKQMGIFILLSLIHFLNLYHNWSVPAVIPVVQFIHQQWIRVLFIGIIAGSVLYEGIMFIKRKSYLS